VEREVQRLKITKDISFPQARRLAEQSLGPVTYSFVASSGPRTSPRHTPRQRINLDPNFTFSKHVFKSQDHFTRLEETQRQSEDRKLQRQKRDSESSQNSSETDYDPEYNMDLPSSSEITSPAVNAHSQNDLVTASTRVTDKLPSNNSKSVTDNIHDKKDATNIPGGHNSTGSPSGGHNSTGSSSGGHKTTTSTSGGKNPASSTPGGKNPASSTPGGQSCADKPSVSTVSTGTPSVKMKTKLTSSKPSTPKKRTGSQINTPKPKLNRGQMTSNRFSVLTI